MKEMGKNIEGIPKQIDFAFEGDANTEVVHTRAQLIASIREKMFNGNNNFTDEEIAFMKKNEDLFDKRDDQVRFNH